ncbi:hypothetical protein [Novosphingobium sp. Gsoil 351]|uniref:hypothetical protein n=1 Tax=Novosphingobium sp. Gsoil 351 TaxID=2675225 RepID=UPI0018A8439A|nr:hypothetical protein [Novosphingobium sp. Gsoil 351]
MDQLDPAALPGGFDAQGGGKMAVDRQFGQMRKQSGSTIGVGPDKKRRPERTLAAFGYQRCGGEAVGVEPCPQMWQRPTLITPTALDRHESDQLPGALETQDLDFACLVEPA